MYPGLPAAAPNQGFHSTGKVEVQPGNAAGVVGGQVDADGFIDVVPFGVVVHLFRYQRDPGHETNGLDKIPENKSFVEFSAGDFPWCGRVPVEPGKGLFNVLGG